MDRDRLKQAIKLKFGTSPTEPTDRQIDAIVEEIRSLVRGSRRRPSDQDWRSIVESEIPSSGSYKYASRDDSDLNDLIDDIIDQAGGPKK